jgi:Na+/H+ antiporter NhaD/arsenite permease-like protein
MRLAIIGALLLSAGAVAVTAGALPLADLAALIDRVAPILLFVVAMTVVTELASEAGVFLWIARRLRHWGRGHSILLWLFLSVFATLSTIFLSLDTTAVLLTPVVVSVTRQAGLPALPFALTTVWLANTASLLFPISNLTNLLAQHSLGGISPASFAALMWAPSLIAVLVPLVFVGIVFGRSLRKRYSRIPVGRIRADQPGPGAATTDRVLLGRSAIVLALLLPDWSPGSRSGFRPWRPPSCWHWCTHCGNRGHSSCRWFPGPCWCSPPASSLSWKPRGIWVLRCCWVSGPGKAKTPRPCFGWPRWARSGPIY